jgi:hypothetical protein
MGIGKRLTEILGFDAKGQNGKRGSDKAPGREGVWIKSEKGSHVA